MATPSSTDLLKLTIADYHTELLAKSVTIFQSELVSQAFVAARFIKTPSEIEMIKYASIVASKAHARLSQDIWSYGGEIVLAAKFALYSSWCGARLQAYNPIVGCGPHAAVLHFPTGESPDLGLPEIKSDTFILVDASPEFMGYASDLTRTYSKSQTLQMKLIYAIVAEAQKTGLNNYILGASWGSICDSVFSNLLYGLIEIGIIRGGTFEELQASGIVKLFMPHGVGHPVGLDVHDPIPSQYYNGSALYPYDYKLDYGMVHTIEPGIYFIPYLLDLHRMNATSPWFNLVNWEVLEIYMHVGGVRIEDVTAIMHDGTTLILTLL